MGMVGLMWWIDRWRKSTAFTDMTLEQQGAYRNLLDEAWLRGGYIPQDERILARASGDVTTWKRVREVVLARFILTPQGYCNETLLDVMKKSKQRVEKQKRYRDRKKGGSGNDDGNGPGNETGNTHGHDAGNDHGNEAGYLDPDPDRELSTEQESSRRARGGAFTGQRLRVSEKQHRVVLDELGRAAAHLDLPALYRSWDAQLVASGEQFDTLVFIKRRAADALRAMQASGQTRRGGDEEQWRARQEEADRRRQAEIEQIDELWLLVGEASRREFRDLAALELRAFTLRVTDEVRQQMTDQMARRILGERFPGRDQMAAELARLRQSEAVA
jgi:uncharacterized protein YdaU (DUF1376 family)